MPGHKKRGNSKRPSFATYIYKVLKQVHPQLGLSNAAMRVCDDYVLDVFRRLCAEVRRAMRSRQCRSRLSTHAWCMSL